MQVQRVRGGQGRRVWSSLGWKPLSRPPPSVPRLFEMGFAEQLQEIIGRLPGGHQTVLFSATLPKLLVEFARAGE